MAFKIINAVLILSALVMSLRVGWDMLTGKPEMAALFGCWGVSAAARRALALLAILGALLLVHPKTMCSATF